MDTPAKCSLEMMLEARDRRRERQRRHYSQPGAPVLLVATVVAPGEYKLTDDSMTVAAAMREALAETFAGHILESEHLDPPSGHETWLSLELPATDAKRLAASIEDSHPLGRLFDLDIIGSDLAPMPRTAIGLEPRRCIICGEEARYCMRAGTHTREEVLSFISQMTAAYRHDHRRP